MPEEVFFSAAGHISEGICDNRMTLRNFIDYTQEQLAPLYPQQECKAMAVRMLKELLAGYKGYEHMVEPGTELDTFQLADHSHKGECVEQQSAPEGSTMEMQPSIQQSGAQEYLLSCVERLATGEPLQYVMGFEWFCGHRFNVAPGVLIPRPETEELVGRAIDFAQAALLRAMREAVTGVPQHYNAAALQTPSGNSIRILDVCTGSGCIAWSIAAAVPQAEVYACDISRQALQIAQSQNIHTPDNVPARVNFFECDILSPEAEQTILPFGKFDIIVSNPPYVCESEKSQMRTNVLEHEPHLALFVPDNDPLKFYRAIAQLSGRILAPGGALMFEINERFGQGTKIILQDLGFENCQVVQDIFGKERMVVGYKNFS